MSKYVLVPEEILEILTSGKSLDSDSERINALDHLAWQLKQVKAGREVSLNPENLIIMLSLSLKTATSVEDKLNDKVIKFLWPIVQTELKERGIL